LALFRSEGKTLGAHDLDVLDPDEGEDCAQVLLLKIVRLKRRSRRVEPPREEPTITRLPPASPTGPVSL
jgi:hypothetical protein